MRCRASPAARRSIRCREARPCRRAGPLAGRRTSHTAPSRSIHQAMPWRCGRGRAWLARREGFGRRRWRRRRNRHASGHSPQRGLLRPADGRAEVHHRLDEIAGTVGRHHRQDSALDLAAAAAASAWRRAITRSTLVSTAGSLLAERDRGDRRRRIIADARKRAKLGGGSRESAAPRDFAGAGDEVAGPGIIAEAGPFGEDVLIARCGQRRDRRPARDEPLEPRHDRRDRGLLEHDLAQPHAIGIGRRLAGRRTPRQAPEVIHIMLEQARRGVGGHHVAMACSTRDVEAKAANEDSPRSCRARAAGDLVGEVGGQSFRRFGFVQSVDRQPLGRDRRRALRQGLLARIDPLPARPQGGRRADPAGRRRACAADPASRADDHRAGQPLLRLCGDRPHHFQAGQAAGAARPRPSGPQLRPVPKELGEGLREIADPELRACLESLAAQIAASSGPPSLASEGDDPIPMINRSN